MTKSSDKFSQSKPIKFAHYDWLRIFTLSDLSRLSSFAEEVEDFLEKELKSHDERAKELVAGQNEEGRKIQMMFLADGYQRYGSDFPDALRYSLFVHSFAKWEHSLEVICKDVQENMKLALSQKDLNGDTLLRSKLYLTKVAGVGFPKNPTTIESLRTLGLIRNLIVHANGAFQDSYDRGKRRAVVAYLKKSKAGSVVNDIRVHLNRAFCPKAISVFQNFFNELFALLKKI